MPNLKELTNIIVNWADGVYPNRTPSSAFMKLFSELGELIDNPNDPLEYADIFIIILDLAHMHNINIEKAIMDKIIINNGRNWGVSDLGILHSIKQTGDKNKCWDYYHIGVHDFNSGMPMDIRSHSLHVSDKLFAEYYEKGYNDAAGE